MFAMFAASFEAAASVTGAALLTVSGLSSASSVEAAVRGSALFTEAGSLSCCGLPDDGLTGLAAGSVLAAASVFAATGFGGLLAGATAGASFGRLICG